MANTARYAILIPVADNLGQPLKDLATAAHHWLYYSPSGNIQASYIEGPKRGNWKDDPQEEFNHLITYADDTPENDSTFKQLAKHIADVANQWGMFVTKEGSGNIQKWEIDNPSFRKGEGADPEILQQKGPPEAGL